MKNKKEYHINNDAITFMGVTKNKLNNDYLWLESSTYYGLGIFKFETSFYGLLNRFKIVYPSGFYSYEWDASYGWKLNKKPISADDLKNKGFIVDGVKVYEKPSITIHLSDKNNITKSFETEEELNNWVEDLKNESNKQFTIIVK
jgi:hypothetical protein